MPEVRDSIPQIKVVAYPRLWRFVGALFYGISRASTVCIGLLMLAGMYFSPPLLLRLMVFLALVPALLGLLIARAFTARVRREGGGWCLVRGGVFRRGERIDLGPDTVRSIVPWRVPAPGPGLTLRLSGQRNELRIELQVDAPGRLLDQVLPESGHALLDPLRPAAAYAHARAIYRLESWRGFVARFVLFPLVPTFILFRLHQLIGYGGLLGQYHLHGFQPYLSTFAFHWILVLMYLVLWASVLRAFAELASAAAARFSTGNSVTVRRWAERAVSLFYYGGVIGLIAVRASL